MAPDLPTRLDRYTVDAHYTALVDHLREGGSPAVVSERAHQVFLEQFQAVHPGRDVPPFLLNLGQETSNDDHRPLQRKAADRREPASRGDQDSEARTIETSVEEETPDEEGDHPGAARPPASEG